MLSVYAKHPDGSYRDRPVMQLPLSHRSWLTPILSIGGERLVGFFDGRHLQIIDAAAGMCWPEGPEWTDEAVSPTPALLLAFDGSGASPRRRLMILAHDGSRFIVVDERGGLLHATTCRWHPDLTGSSTLRVAPISWHVAAARIDLIGVGSDGVARASRFYKDHGTIELESEATAMTMEGYVAAARTGIDSVVAVSRERIHWLGRARPPPGEVKDPPRHAHGCRVFSFGRDRRNADRQFGRSHRAHHPAPADEG
jgi:hypothetical protein